MRLILLSFITFVLSAYWNTSDTYFTSSPRILLATVDAKPNSDGTCYVHKFASGESCDWLIKKFTNVKNTSNLDSWNKDNPTWKGCSSTTPYVGDKVCVSSGNFPDYAPANSNGTCYTHYVASGDNCYDLATKYSTTSDIIEKNNKNTYGWFGCSNLQLGQAMCIGSGNPPRPVANPKAECGPLAPGDKYNTSCPLNACCSEYGFCGITSEFCDSKSSSTNAPGTTGCFLNCGYGSLHSGSSGNFRNVIYWMDSDTALYTDPKTISSDYDTVHYAFINIDSNLNIDYSSMSTDFLSISQKKVVSFGGWDFSTNPSTYKIFRDIASSETNRQNFANAVKDFLNKFNLDGVDIDWEYPGEPDIPDIEADSENSGKNYLDLIKRIKATIPSSKTVSIAIPAAYWYLRGFPVKDLQNYVDYFVLMAYDLHGQWEGKSTSEDPIINCHTNLTEIESSLKMLDKAGVKMEKLVGGIASYGRTFKAADSNCMTPGCKYDGGGNSRIDTNVVGFLADYEINSIASSSSKVKRWTDSESNCDWMIYDTDSVVGWNKNGQMNTLKSYYKDHSLGGSVTWAANYFQKTNYKGNSVDVNLTDSNFNNTYYINHYFNETDKSVVSKVCNLKNNNIDLETCIYANVNRYVEYNDFRYNEYMGIINNIINNQENYDVTYIKIAKYMLSVVNHLASETKAHYKDLDDKDELKKRDESVSYLTLKELKKSDSNLDFLTTYSYIFQMALPLAITSYEYAINYLRDQLVNNDRFHWAHIEHFTREESEIIMAYFPPNDDFDLTPWEYYNYASIMEMADDSITGGAALIDADTFMTNNFTGETVTTGSRNVETVSDYPNYSRMSGYVANSETEMNDLLDNINENMMSGEIPRYPVYVINMNNESPGVAVNAINYINDNIDILSFGGDANAGPLIMRYVGPSDRISRNNLRNIYNADVLNYNSYSIREGLTRDLDEFPFNTLRLPNFDGTRTDIDPTNAQHLSRSDYINSISVSQVDAYENRLDGMYWGRRVRALGPGRANVEWTSNLADTNYRNVIPNDASSSSSESLNADDLVYIVIRVNENTDVNDVAPPAKRRKTN